MAILRKREREGKIQIDTTGPDGNAYALMAYAKSYAEQLGRDPKPILARMMSGDYKNLLMVFDEEFGDYVNLLR